MSRAREMKQVLGYTVRQRLPQLIVVARLPQFLL